MQPRVIIGATVMFAALAAVAVLTSYGNRELYLTVDELYGCAPTGLDRAALDSPLDGGEDPPPRRMQVRGTIDHASVARADEGLETRFTLLGDAHRLAITYRGAVPDTFDQAETATVGGHLDASGAFVADTLLVQCPSKYVPGTLADSEAAGGTD